jgi:hypothetical protein
MFSDTLTITFAGNPKTLTRVNQDGYSSEYLLREPTGSYRLKLRNTSYKDKTRNGVVVDRHNIELVFNEYPVAPATQNSVRKYYAVLENDTTDDIAGSAIFGVGMADFQTEANFTKLLNWES